MAPTKDTESAPGPSKEPPVASKKKDAKGKKGKDEPEELSEEDQKLKGELEMLVERLREPLEDLYEPTLEALKDFIRTSTSSMTAVPKPLKFLRPHYPALTEQYDKWTDAGLKSKLSDVLSVMGMTYSGEGKLESLKYRLLSTIDDIGNWGHEYVRHLALEVGEEYGNRTEKDQDTGDLLELSLEIVPFFLKHNAEADAVDLLVEVEAIDRLRDFVDSNTFARVCLYMVSCVPLLAPPDDSAFLHTAYEIYLHHGQLTQALALAVRIDDEELIRSVFRATNDELVQKQLAYILARQQYWFEVENPEVQKCLSNVTLSEHFMYVAKELNLLDPKTPEDIYKSHLEHSTLGASGILDSAKQNLAAAFVNAFVNCGYSSDKLLIHDEEVNSWIYKTKGPGMTSTTASIGSLFQWDIHSGVQQLDKYMYSSEEQIKAGSLLGIGIVNAGVHDEFDPTFALLAEYVTNPSVHLRASAIVGLGLAYAGSRRADLSDLLLSVVRDPDTNMQLASLAALSLGHIFVGTGNYDISSVILWTLQERSSIELADKWSRFMFLGLALLYMGRNEETEEIAQVLHTLEALGLKTAAVLMTICCYSGTGNVLQIQKLLHDCTNRPEPSKEDEEAGQDAEAEGAAEANPGSPAPAASGSAPAASGTTSGSAADSSAPPAYDELKQGDTEYQSYSVLGLAVIAMGEDIGQEMVLRHFGHLMHYGDSHIRCAVPLAMGLVSASNPQMNVYDTLSRYSHDSDLEVAINAIFAMGLVGAGTNNARLAQLLRQLAMYYTRDSDSLFMVRIAQGLIHLGKGTLTVNPFNTDRQILSRVSLAGLLTVSVALLNPKSFILSSGHSLLYFLTTAIRPRMLITLDENLEPIKVNVRVGQAVDVVGQAGRPKTITGWVTHSTPVLLGYGERAELEDDEYISLASSLEGVVILKKNLARMEVDS